MRDDDDEGARWWRDSLLLGRVRDAGGPLGLLGGAALALGGCEGLFEAQPDAPVSQRAEEVDRAVDALALQRQAGWNVGRPDQPLDLPGASPVDALGLQQWRSGLEGLYARLAPST